MKHNLKFPEVPTSSFQTSPKAKTATYSLLELPSELLSIVDREQESSSTIPPLFIKGDPTSDAVLCTYSKTYSLRAVKNSNSLLLVQLSNEDGDAPGKGGDLEVLQILGRTLEVSLVLPRWEKLEGLLRNSIFDGLENEEDEGKDSRKRKSSKTFYPLQDLRRAIEASDDELDDALRSRRVIEYKGFIRKLSLSYLSSTLSLLLTILQSLSVHTKKITTEGFDPAESLEILETDHEVPREVGRAILEFFGERVGTEGEIWTLKVEDVVREIGLATLSGLKYVDDVGKKRQIVPQEDFIDSWKKKVGESFDGRCDLKLLEANYLLHPSTSSSPPRIQVLLLSTLSRDPSTRFSELFSERAKWKSDDMKPFLDGLAVDDKGRDKLVLKFVRKMRDAGGEIWAKR